MYKTNLQYLQVDTADVWCYEWKHRTETNNVIYDLLVEAIEPILAMTQTPFALKQETNGGGSGETYFQSYAEGYEDARAMKNISHFRYGDSFYSYEKKYVVPYARDPERYMLLFAMKLRQYELNLPAMDALLEYQMNLNFNGNLLLFGKFLAKVLGKFDHGFLPKVCNRHIKGWIEKMQLVIPVIVEPEPAAENAVKEAGPTFIKIPLNTDDERDAIECLRFLFKECNEAQWPLMTMTDFEKLFSNGFGYPSEPLAEKFKLNFTAKYRKSIVEFGLYLVYCKYAKNKRDKVPFLKFLDHCIEGFEGYSSEAKVANHRKNFDSGKLDHQYPFDIKAYFK